MRALEIKSAERKQLGGEHKQYTRFRRVGSHDSEDSTASQDVMLLNVEEEEEEEDGEEEDGEVYTYTPSALVLLQRYGSCLAHASWRQRGLVVLITLSLLVAVACSYGAAGAWSSEHRQDELNKHGHRREAGTASSVDTTKRQAQDADAFKAASKIMGLLEEKSNIGGESLGNSSSVGWWMVPEGDGRPARAGRTSLPIMASSNSFRVSEVARVNARDAMQLAAAPKRSMELSNDVAAARL